MVGVVFISISLALQRIVDAAVTGDVKKLINTFIWVVGYFVVVGLTDYLHRIIEAYYITKTLCHFKKKIFEGLLRQDYVSFYQQNTATYLSSLTNDIHLMDKNYISPALAIISDAVIIVGSTGVLIWFNVWIALAMIVTSAFILIIPKLFGKKLSSTRGHYSQALSELTMRLKDIFLGYEIIKSYYMDKFTIKKFQLINKEVEDTNFKALETISRSSALASYLSIMTQAVSIGLGGYFVIKGQLSIGALFAIVQLGESLGEPIMMIIDKINVLKSMTEIKNHLVEFMDIPDIEATRHKQLSRVKEDITLENVNFAYEEDKNVLNDLSITFEKNKKYAIVGSSGSGKSTLLKLILDEYMPQEGKVMIDHQSVSEVTRQSLYEQVGIIQQNVYLFDTSLKENITLGRTLKAEVLEESLKQSGVAEFATSMQLDLDAPLGENGNKLSGGQKQRIAIARALVQKKPILLLDEYTSSLDQKIASEIENIVLKLEDVTIISVTHKLLPNILKQYDEIIVMEKGSIREKGSFEDLMKNQSAFYNLYYAEGITDCEERDENIEAM